MSYFLLSQTAVAFGIKGVSVINYFFVLKLLNFLLYLLTLPLSKIFWAPPVQAKCDLGSISNFKDHRFPFPKLI